MPACRVSMLTTAHKTLNINNLPTPVVEGVSKLDSITCRDVVCRASMSETVYKIFNINRLPNQIVETQNFASLLPH